jgi:tetratricopeptide (TPR) repeat protein
LQRGDTLNVQVELVDVQTESQLWGERFNRKVTDIFAVEDEIARQISERLRLKLSGQDREHLIRRHTDDTAAYHLYLRGRYHWNKRTADGLKRALEYFQQAIDKDPSYAMAYAGLADGYLVLPLFAPVAARDFFSRGKTAALRALEIDPDLSEAYTALGLIQAILDWDWAGAERSLRRAVELKPEYFLAHDHYAILLSAIGRHDEAVREVRRGLELEPLSLVVVGHHVPWVFIRAGMYDDAIDHCRRALEMEPRFPLGHQWLGLASGLQSRDVEAIESFETARRLVGNSMASFELARAHALSGRTADARSVLAAMHDASTRGYVEPYGFAVVYAALGQKDEAFQWLDRACEVRSGHLAMFVYQDPRLNALYEDPRMGHLLKRMGLALS